jgi:hypothetical protein
MEKTLSLNKEIELFMKMKLSICKCNPCTCSQRKKELYFEELKEVLAKYNKEYMAHMLIQPGSCSSRNTINQ